MRSLSGIGLGLSLVFGCLLLALVVELYYMLWWKKRVVFHRHRQQEEEQQQDDEDKLSTGTGSSSAREFLYMFCCKKVSSLRSCAAFNPQQVCASARIREPQQQQLSRNKDLLLKGEEGLSCLTGPPRFLFTIKEETMEDLESDDGNSRKGSTSLNELLLTSVENETHTPYLTPLPSPPFMTPPITPTIHDYSSSSSTHHGFNPFLESSTDAEISKIKASPPPKFRFLQAAEEKFHRRKMMGEEADDEYANSKPPTATQDSSFITIVIGKHSNDKAHPLSISSQVLPLESPSSPIKR
uniref:Membrane lipoprotein n=1 Tax=Kalanchoe fedtschenkoi TaxID=63787 RepID=A0A7N0V6N0_KALFE